MLTIERAAAWVAAERVAFDLADTALKQAQQRRAEALARLNTARNEERRARLLAGDVLASAR